MKVGVANIGIEEISKLNDRELISKLVLTNDLSF
jgi:hypothetical protein